MKAARLTSFGDPPALELVTLSEREPASDEVLVSLKAASLNRRDAWIWRQEDYCELPVTLGSDGAGIVDVVGRDVADVAVGDEVVIYPVFGWAPGAPVAAADWDILGAPTDGTFAEKVVVPRRCIFPKPARLSWHEAATLGVAGLTAWRATVNCAKVQAGDTVLVTGAGSGVSTFAIQIAEARGAATYVTSSSVPKIARAVALGARGGFSYRRDDWPERARAAAPNGFDAVIDGYGNAVWPAVLGTLRDGGVLVSYGDTGDPTAIVEVADVYWHWRSIVGTSMGSPPDFHALLDHLNDAAWRPAIDSVFPLDEISAAADRLSSPERFGKVIVEVNVS